MIKAAIDRVLELAPIHSKEIGDKTYSTKQLYPVLPANFSEPTTLILHTLTGLVDYAKDEAVNEFFIHVKDFNEVSICGHLNPDNYNKRFSYATAQFKDRFFQFGTWIHLEDFIIALMSQFVQTATVNKLINALGNLANENIVENKDDGFSQKIQIKTGLTMKSEVEIQNPMVFQPFRTFQEIEQPESNCIFRLKDNRGMMCSIHEADGGKWKLTAIERIKAWLSGKLPDVKIIA